MAEESQIPDDRPSWYRARHFDDVHGLVAFLVAKHTTSFAYRGQISRAKPVLLGEKRDPDIEAVFPADFRFFREFDGRAVVHEKITAAREAGRDQRDAFSEFLFHIARAADDRVAWLRPHVINYERRFRQAVRKLGPDWAADAHRRIGRDDPISNAVSESTNALLQLHGVKNRTEEWIYQTAWSLAQHYCLATALLDLTSDARIAAWFATNPWSHTSQAPSSGRGVIYRFNIPFLCVILDKMNAQRWFESVQRSETPPSPMFVVDISRIPPSFAARPSGQRGLSLFGFDQPQAIQFAFYGKAVETFTFDHGSKPYEDTGVNRAAIQPADDPFLSVVRDYEARTKG